MRTLALSFVFILLLGASRPALPAVAAPRDHANPLGLSVNKDGTQASVALPDRGVVAVVDLVGGKLLRQFPMPARPIDVIEGGRSLLVVLDDSPRPHRRRALGFDPASGLTDWLSEVGAERDPRFGFGRADLFDYGLRAWSKPLLKEPATQGRFASELAFRSRISWWEAPLALRKGAIADPSPQVAGTREALSWLRFRGPVAKKEKEPARVFVAAAGSDLVLAIDVHKANQLLDEAGQGKGFRGGIIPPEDAPRYLIATLPTQARPEHLALSGDGKTLVTANRLADSLTVIDTTTLKVLRHIPLGGPALSAARRGEILFHSARLTAGGRFTCASCHPGGGTDGRPWNLSADGKGPARRTRSLLGVGDTAPYGWHGEQATLADRVRHTLKSTHRIAAKKAEVADLVAYLESLPAPSRVLPTDKAERLLVQKGEAIFRGKGGCVTCHRGPTFQDGRRHDVGTGSKSDPGPFDTPSLRGVGRAYTFLHHGAARGVEDIFNTYNQASKHGQAHTLNGTELKQLVAFLKSL